MKILTSLPEIVFAFAIGGLYRNLNWRWLVIIIIGLMVIAAASVFINYVINLNNSTDEMIINSLISVR